MRTLKTAELVAISGLLIIIIIRLLTNPLTNIGWNAIWLSTQALPLIILVPLVVTPKLPSHFALIIVSILFFIRGVVLSFESHGGMSNLLAAGEVFFSMALILASTHIIRILNSQDNLNEQ
ncbi:MAG: hypothetical protein CMD74_01695 [Gammaproteobacteria bacterium]|nr:hypothetical protein [Gammaproteobacteria bacterium]